MDPILIGGIGLGLYLYSRSKKKKTTGSSLPPSNNGNGGGASGNRGTPSSPTDPSTPTGPFDPFNIPTVDPPPQGGDPQTNGGGGGRGDGGRGGGGQGGRTDDPAPVLVPPGTTLDDIGPYTLGLTPDCQEVFEGERWYADVFLPACERLVQLDGPTFNHPYILIRALLLIETDESCAPDEPECNLEPGCILNWPYFLASQLDVPGGEWDSNTHEGYGAFLTYSDWYASNYAGIDAFIQSLESRLWASDLAAHFNQYVDTDIVFVPPGEVA